MQRIVVWFLALAPAIQAFGQAGGPAAAPPAAPGIGALQEALGAVTQALGGRNRLALIRPEGVGAPRDLSGLEAWWVERLGAIEGLSLVPPAEVLQQAGIEFAVSPEGLASVAQRCGTQAALFLRLIESSEGTELFVLLVNREGPVLLDRAWPLVDLPPPVARPAPIAEAPPGGLPVSDASPPPTDEAAPAQVEATAPTPEETFEQRKAWIRLRPARSGVERWRPMLGSEQALGDLDLARLAGDAATAERLEERISALRNRRAIGLGLTLGGFTAAALSLPLLKAAGEGARAAGWAIAGCGLAAGTAGVLVWTLWAPDATAAGGPRSTGHLLTRPEAERLVEQHNDRLRRELGLPPVGELPPTDPQAAGPRLELQLGAGAALRLSY